MQFVYRNWNLRRLLCRAGGFLWFCALTAIWRCRFRTISVLAHELCSGAAEINGNARLAVLRIADAGYNKKANVGGTRNPPTGRAKKFSGYEVHIVKGKL